MHKSCSLCGRELPLESFPTNRGMKDGHLGKCFECWAMLTSDKVRVLAVAERKQAEQKAEPTPKPRLKPVRLKLLPKIETPADHKEYARIKSKERYERLKSDPERYEAFLARHRETSKAYYHNRTEEQRAKDRIRKQKWREENRQRAKDGVKRWRDQNREQYRATLRKWQQEHKEEVIQYQIRSLERRLAKIREQKAENPLQIQK